MDICSLPLNLISIFCKLSSIFFKPFPSYLIFSSCLIMWLEHTICLYLKTSPTSYYLQVGPSSNPRTLVEKFKECKLSPMSFPWGLISTNIKVLEYIPRWTCIILVSEAIELSLIPRNWNFNLILTNDFN